MNFTRDKEDKSLNLSGSYNNYKHICIVQHSPKYMKLTLAEQKGKKKQFNSNSWRFHYPFFKLQIEQIGRKSTRIE